MLAQLDRVCQQHLELGLERGDAVVALGGGVIGDLGGSASIVRRGMRYVPIPTACSLRTPFRRRQTGSTPPGKKTGRPFTTEPVLADTSVAVDLTLSADARGLRRGRQICLRGDAGFFRLLNVNWQKLFQPEPQALSHRRPLVEMKPQSSRTYRDGDVPI